MAYSTLPKDILVSVEQRTPGGLSAEDWVLLTQVLDLIRGAIPSGSNAPPAEVFGVIETALRAHFARAIEP
jgi:hypothetical protein